MRGAGMRGSSTGSGRRMQQPAFLYDGDGDGGGGGGSFRRHDDDGDDRDASSSSTMSYFFAPLSAIAP